MPNHKFHGPWRSVVIVDEGSIMKRKPDGRIHLEITNAQGNLEPGSNHDNKPLTGRVEDLGNGEYAIHLAQRLNPFTVRHYEGVLAVDDGTTLMVCSGEVTNYFEVNVEFSKARSPTRDKVKATADQDEGTWILTKP